MLRVYARTREREKAWKLGGVCLVGSAVGAPIVMLIFRNKYEWGLVEVCFPPTRRKVEKLISDRSPGFSP
jgi:hypothetical protein